MCTNKKTVFINCTDFREQTTMKLFSLNHTCALIKSQSSVQCQTNDGQFYYSAHSSSISNPNSFITHNATTTDSSVRDQECSSNSR